MDKRSKWQGKTQTDSSKDRVTLGKEAIRAFQGKRAGSKEGPKHNGARKLKR